MLINLVIISKACWDILAKKQVDIENTDLPVFLDLLEQIYDLYPHLDADTDFKLLWQYTPQGLLPIKDFITFNAMLKLIGSNSIYVLVNDVEKNYKSTRYYLRMLDKQESRLEKLMSKTKYDVMFPSKKAVGCECKISYLVVKRIV